MLISTLNAPWSCTGIHPKVQPLSGIQDRGAVRLSTMDNQQLHLEGVAILTRRLDYLKRKFARGSQHEGPGVSLIGLEIL